MSWDEHDTQKVIKKLEDLWYGKVTTERAALYKKHLQHYPASMVAEVVESIACNSSNSQRPSVSTIAGMCFRARPPRMGETILSNKLIGSLDSAVQERYRRCQQQQIEKHRGLDEEIPWKEFKARYERGEIGINPEHMPGFVWVDRFLGGDGRLPDPVARQREPGEEGDWA
jgi:hypothetical protein